MATPHKRIGLSRTQVDRAGEILRAWTTNGLLAGPAEQDASRVVNAYRSEFKSPLRSVVMGLRSAVRTGGGEVVVAERLKRQPRLVGNSAPRTNSVGRCSWRISTRHIGSN